jgi:hypothetical protein
MRASLSRKTMRLWGRLDNLIYVLLKSRGRDSESTVAKGQEAEGNILQDGPARYLRVRASRAQALVRQKLFQIEVKTNLNTLSLAETRILHRNPRLISIRDAEQYSHLLQIAKSSIYSAPDPIDH